MTSRLTRIIIWASIVDVGWQATVTWATTRQKWNQLPRATWRQTALDAFWRYTFVCRDFVVWNCGGTVHSLKRMAYHKIRASLTLVSSSRQHFHRPWKDACLRNGDLLVESQGPLSCVCGWSCRINTGSPRIITSCENLMLKICPRLTSVDLNWYTYIPARGLWYLCMLLMILWRNHFQVSIPDGLIN